jgi:hypothetical protein
MRTMAGIAPYGYGYVAAAPHSQAGTGIPAT